MIEALTNHLWQSTLFAVIAGLLTLGFQRNRAQVRYWLWCSASLKFLIPFSLLIGFGSHLHTLQTAAPTAVSFTIVDVAKPFIATSPLVYRMPASHDSVQGTLLGIWTCGFAAIIFIRFRGWRRIRAAIRSSVRINVPAQVEIRSSASLLEPGVVGMFRPILLVPEGIQEYLTPRQLEAVLAHEMCHVRRRDNLTSAIHILAETMFWFHPLVWWLGARLLEERERACDEAVLNLGNKPHDYAEGILAVCRLYVDSPVAWVSGISGSDLKKRVRRIMNNDLGEQLTGRKKLILAACALSALIGPIFIGTITQPRLQAQTPASGQLPTFEVADVKINNGGALQSRVNLSNGRFLASNVPLRPLIAEAWTITPDGVIGPSWLDNVRIDIAAKASSPQTTDADLRLMVRNLLQERMKLVAHTENREQSVLALAIWKNKPKLTPSEAPRTAEEGDCSLGSGTIGVRAVCRHMTMARLAHELPEIAPRYIDQRVVDQTNLQGTWDFTVEWAPLAEADAGAGPSLFAALQAQLGLELKARKLPVPVLVIDSMERTPTSN